MGDIHRVQATTFATLSVGALGVAQTPTVIAKAAPIPMRVELRNVGPVLIFLASSTGEVNPQRPPTAGTYRLLPLAVEVFVLAPGQNLYGVAVGAGGLVSVSISEALPLDPRP